MCFVYDSLSNVNKGIIQMILGSIILLHLINLLSGLFLVIVAVLLIAHGFFHAGFYAKVKALARNKPE